MSTHSTNNQPLPKPLRTQLENTVKAARDVAEKGGHAALAQMAVAEAKAPDYLTDELKALRRRLRAHGRAVGDMKASDDTQGVRHLVWEVAYEQWHRMLFARFLAENGLLLWEPGAAVSLDDCEALVQESDPAMNLGAKTKWELAGKLAARMLPQVFRPQSPVFELTFAPEHQRELERLLAALPPEVFKASDSLGWVYQFWQAKRKEEVNDSEVKIGADELPAVTQLFTEPYMVNFLLHNSLGAWWVTRHSGKACPVPLTYLRRLEDGTPAAGRFEGWPDRLADFRLLDPCCGSGHFLVAAFLMLVPMRMESEGLSAREAVDAVLRDNLYGLEIDPRCVEIAVFALALAAWRFPDENGDPLGVHTHMPAPQVACCGLKVAAKPEDWMALVAEDAPSAAYLQQELRLLHASFARAPLLGSLLDPSHSLKNDLATSSFDTLRELLERALASEPLATPKGTDGGFEDDAWDLAVSARGLLDAARLLDFRYHLVVTNVPYLAAVNQSEELKAFCKKHYPNQKNDLAMVFLVRCLELTLPGAFVSLVTKQDWLYKSYYKKARKSLISETEWNLTAFLGSRAFDTISGEEVKAILTIHRNSRPLQGHSLQLLTVADNESATKKAASLLTAPLSSREQESLLSAPDYIVSLQEAAAVSLLGDYCSYQQGICTGDYNRFGRKWWEFPHREKGWVFQQSTVNRSTVYGGLEHVLLWADEADSLRNFVEERVGEERVGSWLRGEDAWGRDGIAVSSTGELAAARYMGGLYDDSTMVLVPHELQLLPAIFAFCTSHEYREKVRELDSALKVRSALIKVPFDVTRWEAVAHESFPAGIPLPSANDPTQWLFHGHPLPAIDPLQVAVARLIGFRWPAETDASMELSDEAHAWIARCEKLAEHNDDDGIVCLPSVRGEPPAYERVLKLMIDAWEAVEPGSWKPAVLDKLLADADCAGKSLDVWLRDKFFEQHARRFHHRPFIWHVWDGLKDGFAALVNYHQLDAKNLERLIHTYLGDWIRQQEASVRDGVDGAQTRLAAAQDLKRRLELILEGERPYDIFVRWKPLAEQHIGWNPDLNDGVRLNIRPFVTAEVLRHNKKPKLNITWDKDRGKEVESAPWFNVFGDDRINDHHLTLTEKKAARETGRG